VPEPTPPLDALWANVQALTITAGLIAWRIERESAALEAGDGPRAIQLPDPDAAARLPDRLRLPRCQRSAL
jgi:hypothetical protein